MVLGELVGEPLLQFQGDPPDAGAGPDQVGLGLVDVALVGVPDRDVEIHDGINAWSAVEGVVADGGLDVHVGDGLHALAQDRDLVAADLHLGGLDLRASSDNGGKRPGEVQRRCVEVERADQPGRRQVAQTPAVVIRLTQARRYSLRPTSERYAGLLLLHLGLQQVRGVGLSLVDHLLGCPQGGIGDLEDLACARRQAAGRQGSRRSGCVRR